MDVVDDAFCGAIGTDVGWVSKKIDQQAFGLEGMALNLGTDNFDNVGDIGVGVLSGFNRVGVWGGVRLRGEISMEQILDEAGTVKEKYVRVILPVSRNPKVSAQANAA